MLHGMVEYWCRTLTGQVFNIQIRSVLFIPKVFRLETPGTLKTSLETLGTLTKQLGVSNEIVGSNQNLRIHYEDT